MQYASKYSMSLEAARAWLTESQPAAQGAAAEMGVAGEAAAAGEEAAGQAGEGGGGADADLQALLEEAAGCDAE